MSGRAEAALRDAARALAPELGERLAAVRARIAAAARRAGRAPDEVRLVAVSKRQPLERIAAAVLAGARDLGENYVQEARDKRDAVLAAVAGDAPPPRWHLIGPLQRNKAAAAVALFDTVETVDRAALADELARRAAAAGRVLPVLLQVNVDGDDRKSGVAPEGAEALLAACARHGALRIEGLMTIPRAAGPDAARAAFARLRALRDRLRSAPGGAGLRELSMGMSGDFEIAVEEGATSVRVGTAIFGEREDAPRPAPGGSDGDASGGPGAASDGGRT
ncbi:MAG: YggS family pyridoxal phosphate-dependent enzyme [Myxococcota bacterium]